MAATSVFATLGSDRYAVNPRNEHDFYATHPAATEALLRVEEFPLCIFEPCCGMGHIAEVFRAQGHKVVCNDLYDYGYTGRNMARDYLTTPFPHKNEIAIVTNPPFKDALKFVEKAYDDLNPGEKMAFLLRVQFLEGIGRRPFLKAHAPVRIYVPDYRILTARNAEFSKFNSSAMMLCWFIWIKDVHAEPAVKWLSVPSAKGLK